MGITKEYPGHPDLTGGEGTDLHSHAGGGITFTELIGSEFRSTVDNTWTDWDLSGVVPAGTVAILIKIRSSSSARDGHGVRKNGSALVRKFDLILANQEVILLTECDTNRVVEWYSEGTGGGTWAAFFQVLGYWS